MVEIGKCYTNEGFSISETTRLTFTSLPLQKVYTCVQCGFDI